MRRRRGSDAGFTLPEVMVAGTLGLCLALPAFATLRFAYRAADTIYTRFRVNAQARQVFALLGNGTAVISGASADAGARQFQMVEGLRSRTVTGASGKQNPMPPGPSLRSKTAQFVLTDGGGPKGLQITGDTVASLSVPCTAEGTPLPDCKADLKPITVQGWMGSDPTITPSRFGTSYNGSTLPTVAAVSFAITDPQRALRAQAHVGSGPCPAPATKGAVVQGCTTEQYRTIFGINAEASP